MTEAHSAAYLAAVAAAEKAGVIKDGGVVARPRTLGRGEAFGTAALLGEGGVHGEALVAVDTVRCLVLDLRCDPNAACRQALRPLRIRIKGRSERSVSRQSRAVIPLSALRMVAPLGCGAWAHVQLAEHAASGEAFALKTISKREVLRRGTLDVVMKERRLVRMCAHPNVVELYTSYQDADNVHLLFEHLPGGELGALLRRTGPLDQAAARFYAACVLSALEAVHDAGVVRPPLPPPPTRGPASPHPTGPRPTGPLLRSSACAAPPHRRPHRARSRRRRRCTATCGPRTCCSTRRVTSSCSTSASRPRRRPTSARRRCAAAPSTSRPRSSAARGTAPPPTGARLAARPCTEPTP